jgi:inositol-1,3,4-trisphosphate 5/6-kinase/inositol-tetrakisphosphate 1-kinase
MYDMLSSLSYPEQFGGVPRYITANSAAEAVSAATASNLCYPLVVKTVMACGKHDSHVLEIVSSPEHLLQCAVRLPLICQEYINHDGVVHKVYVVDDYVRVVKRQSVRNISESENFHGSFNSQHELPDELANRKMVHANANGNAVLEDQGDPQVESAAAHAAALIREKFGLHLFGFDLLQSSETNGGRLFVVDINYFPSYKKMPDIYERIWDFVQREYNCRVHG